MDLHLLALPPALLNCCVVPWLPLEETLQLGQTCTLARRTVRASPLKLNLLRAKDPELQGVLNLVGVRPRVSPSLSLSLSLLRTLEISVCVAEFALLPYATQLQHLTLDVEIVEQVRFESLRALSLQSCTLTQGFLVFPRLDASRDTELLRSLPGTIRRLCFRILGEFRIDFDAMPPMPGLEHLEVEAGSKSKLANFLALRCSRLTQLHVPAADCLPLQGLESLRQLTIGTASQALFDNPVISRLSRLTVKSLAEIPVSVFQACRALEQLELDSPSHATPLDCSHLPPNLTLLRLSSLSLVWCPPASLESSLQNLNLEMSLCPWLDLSTLRALQVLKVAYLHGASLLLPDGLRDLTLEYVEVTDRVFERVRLPSSLQTFSMSFICVQPLTREPQPEPELELHALTLEQIPVVGQVEHETCWPWLLRALGPAPKLTLRRVSSQRFDGIRPALQTVQELDLGSGASCSGASFRLAILDCLEVEARLLRSLTLRTDGHGERDTVRDLRARPALLARLAACHVNFFRIKPRRSVTD